jgi:hypothetical protein
MARRRGHTDEQILAALRQAEGETTGWRSADRWGLRSRRFIHGSGHMQDLASVSCVNSDNCAREHETESVHD